MRSSGQPNTCLRQRTFTKVIANQLCLLLLFIYSSFGQQRQTGSPSYETAVACEGDSLRIQCEPGARINLIRANFGRFSILPCNPEGFLNFSVNCVSKTAFRIMSNACADRSNCTVLASSERFEDPCPGTKKYLEANYKCLSPRNRKQLSSPTPPTQPSLNIDLTQSNSEPINPLILPPVPPTPTIIVPPSEPVKLKKNVLDNNHNPFAYAPSINHETNIIEDKWPSLPLSPTIAEPSKPVIISSEPPLGTAEYCTPIRIRRVQFGWTAVNKMAILPCPEGANGSVVWLCSSADGKPAWLPLNKPDFSECSSLWLSNIEKRMNEGNPVIILASELATITGIKANGEMDSSDLAGWSPNDPILNSLLPSHTVYSGDLFRVCGLLKRLVEKMEKALETNSISAAHLVGDRQIEALRELLVNVQDVASNLLSPFFYETWSELYAQDRAQASQILRLAVQQNALLFAKTRNSPSDFVRAQPNLYIGIHVRSASQMDSTQPLHLPVDNSIALSSDPVSTFLDEDSETSTNDQLLKKASEHVRIRFPPDSYLLKTRGNHLKLVFIIYPHFHALPLLPPNVILPTGATPIDNSATSILVSDVISILSKRDSSSLSSARLSNVIRTESTKNKVGVMITFLHKRNSSLLVNPRCISWQLEDGSNNQNACYLVSTNATESVCICSQLGSFALMMDQLSESVQQAVQQAHEKYSQGLQSLNTRAMITLISCILSLAILMLGGILHVCKQQSTSVWIPHSSAQHYDRLFVTRLRRTALASTLLQMTIICSFALSSGSWWNQDQNLTGSCVGASVGIQFSMLSIFGWTFLDSFALYVLAVNKRLWASAQDALAEAAAPLAASSSNHVKPFSMLLLQNGHLTRSSPTTGEWLASDEKTASLCRQALSVAGFVLPLLICTFGVWVDWHGYVNFLIIQPHDLLPISNEQIFRFCWRRFDFWQLVCTLIPTFALLLASLVFTIVAAALQMKTQKSTSVSLSKEVNFSAFDKYFWRICKYSLSEKIILGLSTGAFLFFTQNTAQALQSRLSYPPTISAVLFAIANVVFCTILMFRLSGPTHLAHPTKSMSAPVEYGGSSLYAGAYAGYGLTHDQPLPHPMDAFGLEDKLLRGCSEAYSTAGTLRCGSAAQPLISAPSTQLMGTTEPLNIVQTDSIDDVPRQSELSSAEHSQPPSRSDNETDTRPTEQTDASGESGGSSSGRRVADEEQWSGDGGVLIPERNSQAEAFARGYAFAKYGGAMRLNSAYGMPHEHLYECIEEQQVYEQPDSLYDLGTRRREYLARSPLERRVIQRPLGYSTMAVNGAGMTGGYSTESSFGRGGTLGRQAPESWSRASGRPLLGSREIDLIQFGNTDSRNKRKRQKSLSSKFQSDYRFDH